MEGCINTEKDIDKLLVKFESYKKQSFQTIDQLQEQIAKLKEEISRDDNDAALSKSSQTLIAQHNKKVKVSSQKVSSQHKDLHSSVSRIGRTIDKNFDADFNSVNMPEILNDGMQQKNLNTAICEHFYRQGSLAVAESLAKDCLLEVDENWRKPFVEMNEILNNLRNRDVEPALAWAQRNKEQLKRDKSNLEFKLHRQKFLQLLQKGYASQYEALEYAKNFQEFSSQHSQEIQQLMGCFLYIKQGLSMSPYASLLSDTLWDDIFDTFSQDACRMMGMSVDSPLMAAFVAGCQALPALVAIKTVIEQRQCSGVLSNSDELPIDIDLDNTQQYHSVFACPILRQQTTSKNPPLRLVCGHVISRDALNKLVSGTKVKCPYCPVEQAPSDAKEVYF